jgi:ABC-type multidrug transport system fused ATPase/permease subunit
MKKNSFIYVICKIIKIIAQSAPISVAVLFLYSIVNALTPALLNIAVAGMIDSIIAAVSSSIEYKNVIAFAVFYAVIYVLRDFMLLATSILENTGIYEKSLNALKRDFYIKMTKIAPVEFEKPSFLDQRLRAEQTIQDEVIPAAFHRLINIVCSGLTIVSIAVLLFGYQKILVVSMLISVIPYGITRVLRGKSFFSLKNTQVHKNRYLQYLWKLFSDKKTAKEMRVMGFDKTMAQKWNSVNREVNEEVWQLTRKDNKNLFFCNILCMCGYLFSILLIIYLTLEEVLSIGILGACINTFISLQDSVKRFLDDIGAWVEEIEDAKIYFDFLDKPERDEERGEDASLENAIRLRDVSFTYPCADKKALDCVNLEIKKNETVVVLGQNGSGKSTLSKLILGMYVPEQGEVLYDGKSVLSLNYQSIYSNIAVMMQNYGKYNLSIRENIAISDLDKLNANDRIQEVLKFVGMEEEVRRKGGYDTEIGREFDGVEFSGGQWQKIAIARTLFADKPVIIMDEPTSAIDAIKESELLNSFLMLSRNRTAIIISHRVGVCKFADKIVVMKDGKVQEIGTHDELIGHAGEYSRLYNEQRKWYY